MFKFTNIYACTCSKCSHSWSTKSLDLPKVCPKCHRSTWNDDLPTGLEYFVGEKDQSYGFVSNSGVDSAVSVVKNLSTVDRLLVFEKFELCCGMNLGECTCPDEDLGDPGPYIAPSDSKLAAARAALASVEGKTPEITANTPVLEENWLFTNDKPWFADDGNVYRLQKLAPEFKKSRSVRVDEEDHNNILETMET